MSGLTGDRKMCTVMDGRAVAEAVLRDVKLRVEALRARGVTPCLAVLLAGDDAASKIYVRKKREMCERLGIGSLLFGFEAAAPASALTERIAALNLDSAVHGILCQLPLPDGADTRAVLRAVSPEKDVDAFSARLGFDENDLAPCTPAGIMELLRFYGVSPEGRRCVVVGRSDIVGKPMALLLLRENGTVTICHSRTPNLAELTREADILVVAAGRAKLIGADMVKEGAAVIDVGMNRDENGRLCGDVDFEAVSRRAAFISPVPGGVGPMTIAQLMKNTVAAAERQTAKL